MIFINRNLKLNTFGGTHDKSVGGLLMGFPAGFKIDMSDITDMLERRRPGSSDITSARNEADIPIIESGMMAASEAPDEYITTGDPIKISFENSDVKDTSSDEDYIPRPGHGDFTYYKNTGKFIKGASSARSTAPVVFAGALCKSYLASKGIFVSARRISPSDEQIKAVMKEGDSIGGIVECTVLGLPAGFGNPFAEKIESSIAACVFNIPGIKGLEFGLGFELADMKGSEANDPFVIDQQGNIRTESNNCGGVLGGMASGNPLVFRAVFKPTPTISKEQRTVNLKSGEAVILKSESRNDPCIAVRGSVVVEAAAAIALADICLRDFSRSLGGVHSCSGCGFEEALKECKELTEKTDRRKDG